MVKRVQSPSSINTFLQCPRKYYYQYIEKLPTSPNINLVRGNIAHSTLEYFFKQDLAGIDEINYKKEFIREIQRIFFIQWGKYRDALKVLGLSTKDLKFFFEETLMMLINWCNYFIEEITLMLEKKVNIAEAFNAVKPLTEQEFQSETMFVRGFIDVIKFVGDEVHILDYKTNAVPEIKENIRLQLGIYSLLYNEKHGKYPNKVGVFFLRDKLHMLIVDEELVENAKQAIHIVHEHTTMFDKKEDYEKKTSPLCKWKSGQCDFYDVCKPY